MLSWYFTVSVIIPHILLICWVFLFISKYIFWKAHRLSFALASSNVLWNDKASKTGSDVTQMSVRVYVSWPFWPWSFSSAQYWPSKLLFPLMFLCNFIILTYLYFLQFIVLYLCSTTILSWTPNILEHLNMLKHKSYTEHEHKQWQAGITRAEQREQKQGHIKRMKHIDLKCAHVMAQVSKCKHTNLSE